MFPNEPGFICSDCGTQFYFSEDKFDQIRQVKKIQCPGCGRLISHPPGTIERLFRFYPRLVKSFQAMRDRGFDLVGISVGAIEPVGKVYAKALQFECSGCKKTFSVNVGRAEISKDPGLFKCPRCNAGPKLLKETKEFFVCFKNVHDAYFRLGGFEWRQLKTGGPH